MASDQPVAALAERNLDHHFVVGVAPMAVAVAVVVVLVRTDLRSAGRWLAWGLTLRRKWMMPHSSKRLPKCCDCVAEFSASLIPLHVDGSHSVIESGNRKESIL
jgi:hypothetical protein